ncbi:hypothetical protein OCH239_21360 [Roseivivax halodurans JCM 10272]|uniref:ABC transporter substrate-binding protein n=1 Tax=Roseivivax halodurans JCM 10272 TaxID=1449350 RepID=X7E6F6_9RHOB|nr:hypothetical protein [Roseivivax halodurans]ETX10771.1 hypothetical protein OCH239_21360 [Roseivivax halodurans JCM 10272]
MKLLALAVTVAALPTLTEAQDLITRNRVGLAEAPNTLTFRLTAYDLYTTDPETKAAFENLYRDFITARPDWKIETQLQTSNIG